MERERALVEAVRSELARDPRLDASNIGVTVYGRTVTLAGRVAAYSQKRAAENAVRRVAGITNVRNALTVDAIALDGDPDEDISAMAFLALKWDADLPLVGIKAHVRQGVVTLSGEVERQFQRESAEAAISRLRGVRDIVNHIAVKR